MSWFIIASIGYFFLALTFILDKFILTKSVQKPVVYTFYSTIIMFGALLAYPFGVGLLEGVDWFWGLFSGISFGFGLWTLFIAVDIGETSHISPFNGAIVSIASYLMGSIFLQESLTQMQIWGIVFLVIASFMLSFEKSKKHDGFHIGFVWAILSGIFFAASHVSAKYLYDLYPFLTGFVWTRATAGLVGLIVLFYPEVRATLRPKQEEKKEEDKEQKIAKKYRVPIIIGNKVLAIAAVVLIQYATDLGKVSLVRAMSGMQFVLMFFLVYIFTKLTPRFFKEYFTTRELVVQFIALILVAVGSALFVI